MTLDTNIVIAFLGGDSEVIKFLEPFKLQGISLFLPTVVESEFLSFANLNPEERQMAEKFLEENFTSVSFDRGIARIAAQLRRDTKIKFPDAAIAASALFLKTPLITRNVNDFKNIAGLQIIRI